MKRAISILLITVMLIGAMGSFAIADTAPAYINAYGNFVDIYSDYYLASHIGQYAHNGSLIIEGQLDCYLSIMDAGTYNIELHNYKGTPTSSYYPIVVYENATVNLKFYGENELSSSVYAIMAYDSSNVTIELADNSSVKLVTTSEGVEAIKGNVKMKDGSELPAPDENGDITITNGTPTPCAHTNDDETCVVKCADKVLYTHGSHDIIYNEAEGGHIRCCNVCGKSWDTEPHTVYYYHDGEKCVPSCEYCYYDGEPTTHVIVDYIKYDDKYCINSCINCGWGDEQTGLIAHDFVVENVPATDVEGAHSIKTCKRCDGDVREYEKENNIYFELLSEDDVDWDDSAIIAVKNGEPVTLVRNYSGSDKESYAIPYDKDACYSFLWLGKNGNSDIFGAKIYFPDSDEPVFECDDMSEFFELDCLYTKNMADYTNLFDELSKLPESLEYYTTDSIKPLKDAIVKLKLFQPENKQAELDALTSEIKAAAEGLVESDEPNPTGLINLMGDVDICTDEGKKGYYNYNTEEFYEYDGQYVIFCSELSTYNRIYVYDTKADITTVNLAIESEYGSFSIYDAEVTLTALGFNLFKSASDSSYAGIEVPEGSALTITDKTDSIIAIGDDDCAGIGSYHYFSDQDECADAGEITINGGVVYALSTDDGAGLGGGYMSGFEKITINGGRIHAECLNNDGAGIGVGDDGNGGDIVINGGDITALSLDDSGAGIGGADTGHADSITINGGRILVGSDDAAGVGGGGDEKSYGGKITINGGIIRKHFDDSSSALIGNYESNKAKESEYNFVEINGGNIIGDGITPAPKNRDGKSVFKKEFTVSEEFADKDVGLRLSDGTIVNATAFGRYLCVYLPENVTVLNEQHITGVDIKDTTEIFKDVKKNKWYNDAIDHCYSYGFIAGVQKDSFGISTPVTRGMFITVLARIAGVDTSTDANKVTTKFSDVKSGKYYANAIKWASENKVVAGITDTEFKPDAAIERQQLCVMLVNFAKYLNVEIKAYEDKINFADQNIIAKYAKSAVEICQTGDIINGVANGKNIMANPKASASRAEAAQMLYMFHTNHVLVTK